MAVGISSITPANESVYLTVAEYKNAPTSIDYDNLVVGGNQAAQDAELANVILRASSFMNEFLNQNLNASYQVETQQTRITPQGYIAIHPSDSPVISLSSFEYGSNPNNLVALPDCSVAWFENQQIIIPVTSMTSSYTSQGPLGFGGYGYPGSPLFCKYSYVSGFVNTTILTATATQSTLTVALAAGIVAGQTLRIYDGANSETVTVASNYTYGSTTVQLASPLAYTHANGVAIGNLPQTIKQACIAITTAFLKLRGDSSLTMAVTVSANGNVNGAQRYGSDIALALEAIDTYRRVR